jgi:hypothetical protein
MNVTSFTRPRDDLVDLGRADRLVQCPALAAQIPRRRPPRLLGVAELMVRRVCPRPCLRNRGATALPVHHWTGTFVQAGP